MENKSKKNKILLATLIPASLLLVGGAGIGIGYAIWHKKASFTYSLSLDNDTNNELSSITSGDSTNIVKLSASFSKAVWWAGIYLTSANEDVFEDGYVQYSNDGGSTWLSTAPDVGVHFWIDRYQSTGSIEFKLKNLYKADKLINFGLSYCPKQGEPEVDTEESVPILFLSNFSNSKETIKRLVFPLFNQATGLISKAQLNTLLNLNFRGLFNQPTTAMSEPANGENAAKFLSQSIDSNGPSNAASIAALIVCENWAALSEVDLTSVDTGMTFDLEIPFLQKFDDKDVFSFDFNQHWKKNGAEVTYDGPNGVKNNKYEGIDEKFINSNSSTKAFAGNYLTVDCAIRNYDATRYTATSRSAALDLITQDQVQVIYGASIGFPTWMFPNS